MELTPSSRNTMPTVMPMAATLTHGSIRQMKPASVKRMPTARIHPHARTPRARRSNELTHCDTPENELAVTYCNLAELYERMGREADIAKALKLAQDNLHSPTLPHDSYYDFTVSKCLPTFEHFGYKL